MADLDIALRAKDETGPGIRSAENRLRRLGGTIRRDFGGAARFAGAALAGLVAGAIAFASVRFIDFANLARDLRNLSFITGISAETLHRWSIAARLVGVDSEKLVDSIRTFSDFLYEAGIGTEDQLRTINALGLSYLELSRLSPEDQIRALFRALSEIEDPVRRSALANKVFGESGRDLIPLILRFEELELKAAEAGATLSNDLIMDMAELRDEAERLRLMIEITLLKAFLNFIAFVAPVWDQGWKGMTAIFTSFREGNLNAVKAWLADVKTKLEGSESPLAAAMLLVWNGVAAVFTAFTTGNTLDLELWLAGLKTKLEESESPLAAAMLLVWNGIAAIFTAFTTGNTLDLELWLADVRTKLEESESPLAVIALAIWDGIAAIFTSFQEGNSEAVQTWLGDIAFRIANSDLAGIVRRVWNAMTAEFRAGARRSLRWVDNLISEAKRRLRELREGDISGLFTRDDSGADEPPPGAGGGSDGGGGGGGVGPLETASLLLDAFLTGRSILKRTRGTLGGKNRVVQTPVTPSVPIYSPPGFVPAPNLQPISVSLNIDGREFDRATVKAVNNGIRDGQVQVLQGA